MAYTIDESSQVISKVETGTTKTICFVTRIDSNVDLIYLSKDPRLIRNPVHACLMI